MSRGNVRTVLMTINDARVYASLKIKFVFCNVANTNVVTTAIFLPKGSQFSECVNNANLHVLIASR